MTEQPKVSSKPSKRQSRRGTGQIRGKVKEDENGIEIVDAKKLEFGGRRGGGVANNRADPESRKFSAEKRARQAADRKLQGNAN